MIIEKGTPIKIVCQNGMIESGHLVEHTAEQLVLEQLDKSLIIIQEPYRNVLAIKILKIKEESSIVLDKAVLPKDNPVYTEPVEIDEEFKPFVRDESLRTKKLAELHMLRANEERSKAAELLKSNKLKEMTEVQFGTPDFTKPLSKYPKKKARSSG